MTVTAVTFREQFSEFGDTARYPTPVVTMYIALGYQFLIPAKWCGALDFGVSLYTAHQLAVAAQRQQSASVGGVPGTTGGILASKAVDKVSAGYDTTAATNKDAGFWNLTNYGTQFWDLLMMFGAGGFITGSGPLPTGPNVGFGGTGGGWPF